LTDIASYLAAFTPDVPSCPPTFAPHPAPFCAGDAPLLPPFGSHDAPLLTPFGAGRRWRNDDSLSLGWFGENQCRGHAQCSTSEESEYAASRDRFRDHG
jgi:hypothetical protein